MIGTNGEQDGMLKLRSMSGSSRSFIRVAVLQLDGFGSGEFEFAGPIVTSSTVWIAALRRAVSSNHVGAINTLCITNSRNEPHLASY